MRIHVVGYKGVVGNATFEGFRKWGHAVVGTDKGDDHAAVAAELHFVCTPEEVAPEVVRQLAHRPAEESIVIRSTVPPGTTEALSRELRRDLFHNAEFLREKTAQEDFLTRPYAIIGCTKMYRGNSSTLDSAYLAGGVTCHLTDSTTSELVKLLTNTYLATLISLWNENAAISSWFGSNPYEVARLVGLDQRVSPYGRVFLGSAYAGACLPKDVAQLVKALADVRQTQKGLDTITTLPPEPVVLRAVQLVNSMLGGK